MAGPRLTIGDLAAVQVPSAKIRPGAVSGPRAVGSIPPLARPAGVVTVGAKEIGANVGILPTAGAKVGVPTTIWTKARIGMKVGTKVGRKVASRKAQTTMARTRGKLGGGEPGT